MFSRLKGFLYRHRRKFIVTGVLVGGTVYALRYAQQKLREYAEREAKEYVERSRRQQHFKSTERTCDQTILSLAPTMHESVMKIVRTEDMIAELHSASTGKVLIWEKLKVLAFTRVAVLVYAGSMLVLLLRVQLNLLGGYLVRDPTNENVLSSELQQIYLSLCSHLRDTGLKDLCTLIELHVQPILCHVSLKQPMSLKDAEELFWSIQNSVEGNLHENPIRNLGKYVLPPKEKVNTGSLEAAEVSILHNMMLETLDLLESDEAASLVRSCVSQGFGAVIDKLADHFVPVRGVETIAVAGPSNRADAEAWSEACEGAVQNSVFVHPSNVMIPMAKLIPIINKLSEQSVASRDSWIHLLLRNDMVKMFAANVYEAFGHI